MDILSKNKKKRFKKINKIKNKRRNFKHKYLEKRKYIGKLKLMITKP